MIYCCTVYEFTELLSPVCEWMISVAGSMKLNTSGTSEAGLDGYEGENFISLPRKRLSAFCGDYYNSTSIDVKLGVLGNECFLNGLSFVPNVIFVLVAVPVLISWNKSIFASMHVKTWVRFPHHTIRWLLMLVLIITNLFEVCCIFFLANMMNFGGYLNLVVIDCYLDFKWSA